MLNAWHQPVPPFVVKQGQRLDITLWLQGDELPERVFLRAEPDNEEWLLVMKAQRYEGMRRYQASLTLNEGEPTRRYCFKLLWADRQQWFGPQGWSPTPPGQLAQFAVDEPDHGPEWVADQLFYQIFPDRFASSGGEHGIQSGSYRHHAAGAEVIRRDWQHPLEDRHAASTFYGGDLDGICAKLPYLQQLGVTALYLNPIFTAPSVHKYDTEDYYQVDPHFGGNAALQRLRVSTHKVGMKLVLDGVFNHTGDSHPWFDRHRQGENGACHHPDSPYRGWFNFYPDGRALDWKGNASLPKLNFAEPQVAEAIYRGEGSVVRHWLRPPYSIDGWRLDVVHMLGENGGATGNLHHLAGIYQAVKQENPQAYVLGEHFGDARRWLHAGVEDAAMNYMGFALPVRAFLAGLDVAYHPVRLDAAGCAQWMDGYRAGLPHGRQLIQFNQLDSHDTARFLTLLQGNAARMQMAAVWLLSWIGVPCLYYGDEIGLDGGNDPFCRKPFPWDVGDWERPLLALFQRMAALRKQSVALRRGGCQVLYASGETLVFVRLYQQEQVLVALQRDGSGQAQLPHNPLLARGPWRRVEGRGELSEKGGGLRLQLAEESATVWRYEG
ncbi:maltodextrin glucosidase [Serratia marcescens]|uniref:maltodextrin glucosidase n=1 Tax=Serratia marcescens TaxID=615 RepID=UPI001BD5375A|nr:maltodextrin glucosidase [Serratia marcescens]UKG75645.1 maltodextrin glucosidase [Serratia marcescens]